MATVSKRLERSLQSIFVLLLALMSGVIAYSLIVNYPLRLPNSFEVFPVLATQVLLGCFVAITFATAFLPPRVGMLFVIFGMTTLGVFVAWPRPIYRIETQPISSSGNVETPSTFSRGFPYLVPPPKAKLKPERLSFEDGNWLDVYSVDDDFLIDRPARDYAWRQHHTDFDMLVHQDSAGWRAMPDPKPVVFVGCSFTFGMGVQDNETFTNRLATEAWPFFRVVNISKAGAGTNDALLALRLMKQQGTRPGVVIYGFITSHLKRNYRRKSWHFPNKDSLFAHFEIEDNKLVYKGNESRSICELPDNDDTTAKEEQITLLMLKEMEKLCQDMNCRFIIVVLQDNENQKFTERMQSETNIPLLNASQVSADLYPNDHHPRATWHQSVARHIASSKVISETTGESGFFKPNAIPLPRVGWALQVFDGKGAKATAKYGNDGSIYVKHLKQNSADADSLRIMAGPFTFRAGEEYRCRCKLKSSAEIRVNPYLTESKPPYNGIGVSSRITVSPAGTDIDVSITPTVDLKCAVFAISFGQKLSDLEAGFPSIENRGHDMMTEISSIKPTSSP